MGCCCSKAPAPAPPAFYAVGPVVGSVDGTSARILIETKEESQINVIAEESLAPGSGAKGPYGLQPVVTFSKVVPPGTPTVLVVKGLKPGFSYRVTLAGTPVATAQTAEAGVERKGGSAVATFTTIPSDGSALRFGVVSCNNFLLADKSKLWTRMQQEVKSSAGLAYLLHVGDQVYADGELYKLEKKKYKDESEAKALVKGSAWQQGRDVLSRAGNGPSAWATHRAQVTELFRDVYRKTWSAPDVAGVLASVPNLMVLDDHELRDDYGDRPEDCVRDSMEYFLGTCALQAYHEYQTQLHRDVNLSDVLSEKAYSSHVIAGKIGFFLMDLRVERSLRRSVHRGKEWAQRTFMGPGQHDDFDAALQGQFKEVSQLFVVSPTPLVLLSEQMTMFLSAKVDDLLGTWTAKQYIDERDALLKKIVDWADKSPRRSVAVLAGDIHIGGHSEITLRTASKRSYTIHQLTSSAVVGDFYEEQELQKAVGTVAMKLDADLTSANSDIKFKHSRYQYVNNAGVVEVTRLSESGGRPSVKSMLLLGNDGSTKKYDLTMAVSEPSSCSIM